jgi:hypothetical protein
MDATMAVEVGKWQNGRMGDAPRVVSAAEFRQLLVSHRHLVRVQPRQESMRALQDVDTGELFLTDAQRLLNSARSAVTV